MKNERCKIFFFYFKGIQLNDSTVEIYEQKDHNNSNVAKNLLRSGVYTVLFFLLPNAIPPLTHLLFGLPSNVLWNFPFAVMCVCHGNILFK